jgi:hypothetical protein
VLRFTTESPLWQPYLRLSFRILSGRPIHLTTETIEAGDRVVANHRVLSGFTVRVLRDHLPLAAVDELARTLENHLAQSRISLDGYGDERVQPTFVYCDSLAWLDSFADLTNRAFQALTGLRTPPFEVIGAHPTDAPERGPPLELPLTLACEPGLRELLQSKIHFLADASVREHAFTLQDWRSDRSAPPPADILILSERHSLEALERFQRHWYSKRPRLVIALDTVPRAPLRLPPLASGNVAVAVLRSADPSSAVQPLINLLYEIVHDLPLHQAVSRVRRAQGYQSGAQDELTRHPDGAPSDLTRWSSGIRLYATPAANESLRLSSVLPQVSAAVDDTLPSTYMGVPDGYLDKVGKALGDGRTEQLRNIFRRLNPAVTAFRRQIDIPFEFSRETTGLVPIARVSETSSRVREAVREVTPELQSLLAEPGVLETLEDAQARGVNAKLFHLPRGGVGSPVNPGYPLDPGSKVLLRINIGPHESDNLVDAQTPAIDPLLPPLADDQTHELLITLFPEDFHTDSPHTAKVTLSRLGGTKAVEWRLTVPQIREPSVAEDIAALRDISLGSTTIPGPEARLRFGIYFNNQLLQSFLLSADIGALRNERAIRIVCDFSQTRRFGALDTLQPRLLSLGVNANSPTTHTLTVAGTAQSAAVQWSEPQLAGYAEAVRATLYDAMTDAGRSRFEFDPVTLQLNHPAADAIFDEVVRNLADRGGALYAQLFAKSYQTPLRSLLQTIRQSSDQTIQIVLHDPTYAFPWSLVYDYNRPESPADKQAAVCRGLAATLQLPPDPESLLPARFLGLPIDTRAALAGEGATGH